jgi:hypothetical protein
LVSRRVVHVGVTRHPSDAWVAQQLREATPFGQHPKHLITDNDSKYGPLFAHVARATGIDHIRTAYRAPRMNAIVERLLGSIRREYLDYVLVLHEQQLLRVLREYVIYFNSARSHQGLHQRIPEPPRNRPAVAGASTPPRCWEASIIATVAWRDIARTRFVDPVVNVKGVREESCAHRRPMNGLVNATALRLGLDGSDTPADACCADGAVEWTRRPRPVVFAA